MNLLQNAALDLLNKSMIVAELAINRKSIEDFGRRLRGLTRGLWAGEIDRFTFVDSMNDAIQRGFNQAWTEGARSCGIEPTERSQDEEIKLQEMINSQLVYLPGLADWVLAHSSVSAELPAQVLAEGPTGGTFTEGSTYRESKVSPVFDRSIELNDSVLGTGDAKLNINLGGGAPSGMGGLYEPWGNGTGKIKITKTGDWDHITALHEMGHAVDHQLLSENLGLNVNLRSWASESRVREVREFWDAVEDSPTYKKLIELRKTDGEYVDYLLEKREIFARSYSEYITFKSMDQTLINELVDNIERSFYPEQWSRTEFEPIAKAMDALFRRAGMLQ